VVSLRVCQGELIVFTFPERLPYSMYLALELGAIDDSRRLWARDLRGRSMINDAATVETGNPLRGWSSEASSGLPR
jgi:hypothetical protein